MHERYKNRNLCYDDSVTDDMLIHVLQKFEQDKGLCLGNDDENDKINKILYKK